MELIDKCNIAPTEVACQSRTSWDNKNPSQPGTYALVLAAFEYANLMIGKLGSMQVIPGYYVYTGSAFGPGGLRARLNRHLGSPPTFHWHIDYLRRASEPVEIWTNEDGVNLEHAWAEILRTSPGAVIPKRRFGASDCRCPAHLVYYPHRPEFERFLTALPQTGNDTTHIRRWVPWEFTGEFR
jgi:Uri superfamily endonuclease